MLTREIMLRLAAFAEISGEKISDFRLEFTAKKLDELGPGVLPALERLLETSRRFPIVAEVKAAMGMAESTPEDEGRAVAAKIWAGVAKFGELVSATRVPEVQAYVGPIGWMVVELEGGWNHLVQGCTYDAETTLKAQWRELAIVVAKRRNDPSLGLSAAPGGKPLLTLLSGLPNVVDIGRKNDKPLRN
jgi:hypothetical protein